MNLIYFLNESRVNNLVDTPWNLKYHAIMNVEFFKSKFIIFSNKLIFLSLKFHFLLIIMLSYVYNCFNISKTHSVKFKFRHIGCSNEIKVGLLMIKICS